MSIITEAQMLQILGPASRPKEGSSLRSRQDNIIKGFVEYINAFGSIYGLDKVVNLARFIGQLAIESDYFRTTKEYATGAAYEGRKDLGNVEAGDGTKYRGRGLIQVTGRSNVTKFNAWVKKSMTSTIRTPIPDFVNEPANLEQFPWALWSAIWFWSNGNRTGKSLNSYAASGNDEMITRVINGGLTHYDRRLEMTARASLVLLDYDPGKVGIVKFQKDSGLIADGIIGAKTRGALHQALLVNDSTMMIAESNLLQPLFELPVDHLAQPEPEPAPVKGPGKYRGNKSMGPKIK